MATAGVRFRAEVAVGKGTVTVPIDADVRARLADDALILVSWAEDTSNGDGVNAWSFPIEAGMPGRN